MWMMLVFTALYNPWQLYHPFSNADISIVWTLNNLNWLVANLNSYSLYSCKNQQLKTAIQVMDNRKIY